MQLRKTQQPKSAKFNKNKTLLTMKNPILDYMHKQRFNYVHAIEVNDIYELQSVIESCVMEFDEEYTLTEIIEFFNTMSIYALNEENEEKIYNFNIENSLKSN